MRVHLPPERPQDQLSGGVIVLVVGEVHPVHQRQERLGLRLRGRPRAAVGLGRGVGVRSLVVVVPARREVPVRVHAVDGGDLPVAVVVAQVLPPEPVLRVEGEVVAVGVRDQDEPQLAVLHQLRELLRRDPVNGLSVRPDGRALLAVVVEEEPKRAALGLAGEPLAGVLDGRVEHGRPAAVLPLLRVLRDLHRVDRKAAQRMPDRLELRDPRILRGEVLHLRLDVRGGVPRGARHGDVGTRVRTPDLPAACRLGGRGLERGAPAARADQLGPDAGPAELSDLRVGGDDLDTLAPLSLCHVEAQLLQLTELIHPLGVRPVGVQPDAGRCGRGDRKHEKRGKRNDDSTDLHASSPLCTAFPGQSLPMSAAPYPHSRRASTRLAKAQRFR